MFLFYFRPAKFVEPSSSLVGSKPYYRGFGNEPDGQLLIEFYATKRHIERVEREERTRARVSQT